MRLLVISNSTNPGIFVAGLREGTMLIRENEKINLYGPRKVSVFKKGFVPLKLGPIDDLSFLLK